uniref:Uncharacterized protein n=1 Tax=Arion vulgaris TaxID=1028688 RepID=A0A0B7BA00_9EUPU
MRNDWIASSSILVILFSALIILRSSSSHGNVVLHATIPAPAVPAEPSNTFWYNFMICYCYLSVKQVSLAGLSTKSESLSFVGKIAESQSHTSIGQNT